MAINPCGICYKEVPENFFVPVTGPSHPIPHFFHYVCILKVLKSQQTTEQTHTCPCSSRITHVNGIPTALAAALWDEIE